MTFLSLLLFAGTAVAESIAVTNVSVIDCVTGGATAAQTVVVKDGRVTSVTSAEAAKLTAGSREVDGRGKFLMPGLWDMHVHVLWPGGEEYVPLFIANGITGIRDMHTTMPLEQVRQAEHDIADGRRIGPRLVFAGPIVDGPQPFWPDAISVNTGEEARAVVRRLHGEGVSLIKVYEHLPREAYFAIADECKKLGLPFGGHVPQSVNAIECAKAGQRSIEHLSDLPPHCGRHEGELLAPEEDTNPPQTAAIFLALKNAIVGEVDRSLFGSGVVRWFSDQPGLLWRERMERLGLMTKLTLIKSESRPDGERKIYRADFEKEPLFITMQVTPDGKAQFGRETYIFDTKRAEPVFALLRESHTWQCPTLTVHTTCYRDRDEALRDPNWKYISAELRRRSLYDEMPQASSSTKRRFEQYLELVKGLQDAGVGILAGTDGPLGSLPGFGLHQELELLVKAGLKPIEALQAATLNPARYLGREAEFGTIEAGKLADLVLLDANPLEDIRNTRRVHAVIARGLLFDRVALDELLANCEAAAKRKDAQK